MFKKVYRTALQTANRINEDEIFVYAAQASFYIITASIPFMMLFLALYTDFRKRGCRERYSFYPDDAASTG